MTNRFMIIGLPRSMTAWLAAFFTDGDCICYHEPGVRFSSIADLSELFSRSEYAHTGVSDTALGFFSEDIIEPMQLKTVIIERDVFDVENSLHDLGFKPNNLCYLLSERLANIVDSQFVLRISFESLQEKDTIENIAKHIGVPFNGDRFDILSGMNIEADVQKINAAISHHSKTIATFMGGIFKQVKYEQRIS